MPDVRGTPLVGRTDEVESIRQLLDRARSGTTRFVVIEGEPGMGKSRLLEEVVAWPGANGLTVHRARAEELQGRPFGLLADALGIDPKAGDPERLAVSCLLAADGEGEGRATDRRYRVIEAIADLVEREAMRQPAVLVLDDLQWADPSSVQALHSFSRRLAYLPVAVLMACRPLPRSAELARMLDVVTEAGGSRLRLDPLDGETVGELAAARLEADPGPALRARLDGAAGNPLFVLELLDALSEQGVIEHTGRVAETAGTVEAPASLRATVLRRLAVLRPASLDLLRSASLFGGSFSAGRLSLVTGTPLLDVLSLLEEPITMGFVTPLGEMFAFRHDVVREALYLELPAPVRKGLHLHMGRALAEAGASPAEVANHLALGAEHGDREAVDWIRRAARELRSSAPGMAVQLLKRASSLVSPQDPEWAPLVRQEIKTLAMVGRVREAAGRADDAIARACDPVTAFSLSAAKIGPLIFQSRFEELAELIDGLLLAGPLPAEIRAELLAYLAIALSTLCDERCLGVIAELGPYAEAHPRSRAAALYNSVDGRAAWALGFLERSVQIMEGAVAAAVDLPGLRAQTLVSLGAAQLVADRLDEAVVTFGRARAELERSGNVALMPEYHWCLAQAHFVVGRWDDALAETATSRQLIDETGAGGARSVFADDPSPLIHLHRGDVDAAGAALARAEGDSFATAARVIATGFEPMRALVEEGAGRPEEALRTWAAWRETRVGVSAMPDYRGFARTLARASRSHGEHGWLDAVTADAAEMALRAGNVPSVRGTALLLKGMLEADSGSLLQAVDAFRAGPRLFDRAEACAEAALVLVAQGDTRQGRALAAEAFDLYAEMGAQRPQAALAAELRAFGVRRGARGRRQRPVSGWASLTSTEERIARHVAAGLTNGEIGERLYISRGTVATHLRSVFRKLTVSSRAELAAEAARHPGMTESGSHRETRKTSSTL